MVAYFARMYDELMDMVRAERLLLLLSLSLLSPVSFGLLLWNTEVYDFNP